MRMSKKSCIRYEDLSEYEWAAHCLFGWHISDLKIYDRPLDLQDFTGLQKTRFGLRPVDITRPPQSWFYVEERQCM